MISFGPRTLSESLSAICAAVFYGMFFWRTFKQNPGNRFVECGMITLMAFFALMLCNALGAIPEWLFFVWLILVLVLSFSTLFYLGQRAVRFIRHCRQNARSHHSTVQPR